MNSQRLPLPPWRPHLEDPSEGALAQVPVVDDGIAVVLYYCSSSSLGFSWAPVRWYAELIGSLVRSTVAPPDGREGWVG